MTILVSVDQSLTCSGVCIFDMDTGALIQTMTVVTKPDEFTASHIPIFHRTQHISDIIIETIQRYEATHFCIEGLAMGNVKGNSSRDLAILQGMIVCNVLKIIVDENVDVVSPTAVKKFATGKGNAKKEDMFEAITDEKDKAMVERYKKTKGRYDVSDAYHIGKMYIEAKKIHKN